MVLIPTTNNCPECSKKGITARLNLDLATDEYSCAKGHTFRGLEEIQAAGVTASEPGPSPEPPEERQLDAPPDEAPPAMPPQAAPEPPQPEPEAPAKAETPAELEKAPSEPVVAKEPVSEALDQLAESIGVAGETMDSLRAQVEQLQVQLAGCATAAQGHTSDPAKKGDYGWSPAYQDVLELRLNYDALVAASTEKPAADRQGPGLTFEPPPTGPFNFRPVSTPLPGGEAVVIIHLSETCVDMLRVEAENQGKPWELFLQEHLNFVIPERGSGAF